MRAKTDNNGTIFIVTFNCYVTHCCCIFSEPVCAVGLGMAGLCCAKTDNNGTIFIVTFNCYVTHCCCIFSEPVCAVGLGMAGLCCACKD